MRARPVAVANDAGEPGASLYNRGYKEVDTSEWCRRRLWACMRQVQATYADSSVRDGSAGLAHSRRRKRTGAWNVLSVERFPELGHFLKKVREKKSVRWQVRVTPREASGDALMVRVGKKDGAFFLTCFSFSLCASLSLSTFRERERESS